MLRRLLFGTVLVLTLIVAVPHGAQAASGFYGPIISDECRCPGTEAPGYGCVLETIRVLMNFGITIAGLIAVLIIVYAGFLFLGSTTNPEMRSQARSVLINAIIGMVIVLCAWLVVDAIMGKLYNPDTFGTPWNSILSGGDQCIQATAVKSIFDGPSLDTQPDTGGPATGATGGGTAVSSLSAQEAAKKIISSPNISSTNSVSSCGAYAGATSNLQQIAAGNGMSRCPCGGGGSVAPSDTLLNSLIDMGNAGAKLQINVIAGGCHLGGANDNHYLGKAADIQRNSTLDTFFARYPRVTCQGSKTGYKVSGEVVCLEDSSHYHVSPTGN